MTARDDPDLEPAEVLRSLERRRLAALVARDAEVMESLHADDYELVTPGGRPLSRADYLEGVLHGPLDYRVFQPAGDIRVRLHSDVAVLRYIAEIEMHLPDGVDADRFWHTDVYERRDDRWVAVWSHATRIKSG